MEKTLKRELSLSLPKTEAWNLLSQKPPMTSSAVFKMGIEKVKGRIGETPEGEKRLFIWMLTLHLWSNHPQKNLTKSKASLIRKKNIPITKESVIYLLSNSESVKKESAQENLIKNKKRRLIKILKNCPLFKKSPRQEKKEPKAKEKITGKKAFLFKPFKESSSPL